MDRLEELQKELNRLKARLSRIEEEMEALRRTQDAHMHPVETLLRQNGFPILSHGLRSDLLFQQDIPDVSLQRLYELMRRYSFRLFLRDLIRHPEGENVKTLSRYCSVNTARSYLRELAQMGVVHFSESKGYTLLRKEVTSFGPTLEWYVCEIMRREFMAPALFNLKLRHTRSGGDYDVVTILAGRLAAIEVKSSPPPGGSNSPTLRPSSTGFGNFSRMSPSSWWTLN